MRNCFAIPQSLEKSKEGFFQVRLRERISCLPYNTEPWRVADYSREIARREIENGSGTQFDPKYVKIMLEMIDEDKEYKMKE